MKADVVTVDVGHARFDLPVHVQPGLHPDVIAIAVGYGRTAAGRVGNKVGQNAFNAVQATGGRFGWSGMPARLLKTGRQTPLACVQGHQYTEDRPIVFETTFASYLKDPSSGKDEPASQPSMWTPHKYPGYRWGLGIDMNACIGCAAFMIACQVENNVPVVGKSIVLQGREMHWLRIDRYYAGSPESPETAHQPMLCQHCENAPCETVCPVLATVHNSEGLNIQIYNRCVGTRYCSNNCPYKVRRFNFFQYADYKTPSFQEMYNPNVTVRERGVMEKCTYCVQRITQTRIDAEAEGRRIGDGEVRTACQQACPNGAIVFGDISDRGSEVARRKASPLNYDLLGELNTRPRTTYLARLRNPNPEIEGA
jgi:molybdopterin-containing oxidoreductase family iron-sulfur binding subunit